MSRGEFRVKVETLVDERGRIVQTISALVAPEKTDPIQRTVMDVAEEQTRKSLIRLGWVPPSKGRAR